MPKIQYPIEIHGIDWGQGRAIESREYDCKVGDLVRVRPVGEEYGNKTYLGVYIGDVARSIRAVYNQETKKLEIDFALHNPAMFVPDLNKIIYGYESWWSRIESQDQLKDITDEEISNVWYVKALKQIAEAEKECAAEEGGLDDASEV